MTQTAEVIKFERPYVKADIDNGYDRLAHDLTNALANPPVSLSGREYQVIMAVISKTYRYHKPRDWIASTQLSDITGIDTTNIGKVKRSLIKKNILIESGRVIGLNTVISEWVSDDSQKELKISQSRLNKNQSNPTSGKSNPTNGQSNPTAKPVESDPHNKKTTNTKETITKENIKHRFAVFWDLYPKKVSKKDCLAKFSKLNPDEKTFSEMIQGLKTQIQWRATAPQGMFIPEWKNPSTWLNGECWEDEIKPHIHQQSLSGFSPKTSDFINQIANIDLEASC